MKYSFIIFLALTALNVTLSGQGETELRTDGIAVPALTTAERDAIVSPANGQIIFNETAFRLEVYDTVHAGWKPVGDTAPSTAIPNRIENLDEDSFVKVQESASSDHISMELDGDPRLRLVDNNNNIPRLEFYNAGNNISIGDNAGLDLKDTGFDNISIGQNAHANNAIGDHNIAIGTKSLFALAFDNSSTGIPFAGHNVAVGYEAMSASDILSYGNTAIGYQAGQNAPSDISVYLGYKAGKDGGTGVYIGNEVGTGTTLSTNNALFIGNDSGNRPLLYGQFDNKKLTTYGDFDVLSEGTGQDITATLRSTSTRPVLLFTTGGTSISDGMSIEYDGQSTLLRKKLHFNDRNADAIMTIEEGSGQINPKVGINTTTPTGTLHVVGDAYITGIPTPGGFASDVHVTSAGRIIKASSDVRLKKNIATIDQALSKVLAMRGTSFEWKEGPNPNKTLGVIAQEVLEVVPDIVTKDGEYYGVNYSEIPALLIEAIKEQQKTIDLLTQRIIILESNGTNSDE